MKIKIDDNLISKLERLSKLKLNTEERDVLKGDLEKMLGMIEKIQEVDTEGVEPLISPSEVYDRVREDIPAEPTSQEEALRNTPHKKDGYIIVPKVKQR
jgi:aspartyl-tRNA(Asn)/glutamyl-tRNA(Gln) amidotransferase subunit C